MKGFWVTLLCAALISLMFNVWAHASSFKPTPLPYSCEQVRWAVNTFTPEHLRKLSNTLDIHLTGAQMHQATLCLKGGRHG